MVPRQGILWGTWKCRKEKKKKKKAKITKKRR